ncbi:MAG: type II secretion system F family protein [Deltaproteobacteria bacterium]|nr:type II secretion system F family protein [Deltaproteobacteria bacterium]
MPSFSHRSIGPDGSVSEGLIEARNEYEAESILKNSNVIPLRMKEVPAGSQKDAFTLRSAKGELLVFTTELYTLINAGLPLDRSLNVLLGITQNKKMKDVIFAVLKSIREGGTFSDALARHPKVFSPLYVNMIRAGETSGAMEMVLEKLIEFLESSEELKNHIFSAMIYPVILVMTGAISILVLVTFVLPKFTNIFADMGTKLPFSTQILIGLSNFLLASWWIIGLGIVFGSVFLKSYLKTDAGRYTWDKMKLKILGDVILKLETARFCRTLGALLKSGVPLLQAVKNAKDIIGNFVVSSSLDRVTKEIKEGKGIAKPLSDAGIFPELAMSMIQVGEETGRLDGMLIKIADTYEKSLKISIRRFISIMEPSLIIAMGLIVGFIVISLLTAIFSITDIPF